MDGAELGRLVEALTLDRRQSEPDPLKHLISCISRELIHVAMLAADFDGVCGGFILLKNAKNAAVVARWLSSKQFRFVIKPMAHLKKEFYIESWDVTRIHEDSHTWDVVNTGNDRIGVLVFLAEFEERACNFFSLLSNEGITLTTRN